MQDIIVPLVVIGSLCLLVYCAVHEENINIKAKAFRKKIKEKVEKRKVKNQSKK